MARPELWREEEDRLLIELWPNESLSREDIGKRFDPPKTKNAIIGRARRIGLPRLKGSVHKTRVPTLVPRERRYRPPRPRLVVKMEEITPIGIPIVDAQDRQCRAIVGTDEQNLAIFCGHPTSSSFLSYCGHHLQAYTVPSRR